MSFARVKARVDRPSALRFVWIAHIKIHFDAVWERSPRMRNTFIFTIFDGEPMPSILYMMLISNPDVALKGVKGQEVGKDAGRQSGWFARQTQRVGPGVLWKM